MRALNPQYKTGLVPGSSKPQSLTLPMNHLGDFINLNDTIRSYKPDVYLNKNVVIADPKRSTFINTDIKGKTKLIYTVKDGDNIGSISEWYKVGLSDLRNWNNIYKNKIRVGQKIVVYVNPLKSDYYSKINTLSYAEKQALVGKIAASNTQPEVSNSPEETDGEFITYTVRNGDTIWDIVKMFDNVTTTQVLSLNNIADPGKIKVGQNTEDQEKELIPS